MEAYYSSDEEVAWGPVTLREIKRDLSRPRRKINQRHTTILKLHEPLQMTQKEKEIEPKEISAICQEVEDRLNVSGYSQEYFTPNASIRTEQSSNSSQFLEKLKSVISEPLSDTSYATAMDNINGVTFSNFDNLLKNAEASYLENCKHTLVENTVILSSDEEEFNYEQVQVKTEKIKNFAEENSFTIDNSIIVIDDNSNSSYDGESQEEIENSKVLFESLAKESTKDQEKSSEAAHQLEYPDSIKSNLSYEEQKHLKYNNEQSIGDKGRSNEEPHQPEHPESLKSNLSYQQQKLLEFNSESSENDDPHLQDFYSDSLKSNDSYEQQEHLKHNTKELDSWGSPIQVPEINIAQFNESHDLSSECAFNDTLEEMEAALNQGLDYTMPEDNLHHKTLKKNNTSVKQAQGSFPMQPLNIISGSFLQKNEENSTLYATPSRPVLANIPENHKVCLTTGKKLKPTSVIPVKATSKSAEKPRSLKLGVNDNFKVPITRPVRAKLTPTHLNFKNIVSPVGVYIKNTPSPTLKHNIANNRPITSNIPKRLCTTFKPNKMYSAQDVLSEIVYKPSAKQVANYAEKIILPTYFQKLNIKSTTITKHEIRIKQIDLSETAVNAMLLESDLTTASLNEEDISFITNKDGFKK